MTHLDNDTIKTGILGGTFDPIHKGHIQMALSAAREYDLDEMWLMPNGSPPHKNDRYIAAPPKERLAMTQLAIDDVTAGMNPPCTFTLCDYEIKRRKTSYSYETMEHFCEEYPKRSFYFIIGADSLMDLTKWVKPERLLKTCVMLAIVRGTDDEEALRLQIDRLGALYPGCDIRIVHMPKVDISSTEIREKLRAGERAEEMLTPSVAAYIREHPALYKVKSTEKSANE